MIIVHYGNGNEFRLDSNNWPKVPNKREISRVEYIRETDGRIFSLEKPPGTTVQFFAQLIGYSHMTTRGKVLSYSVPEQQLGMIFSKDHVEILEIGGDFEKPYTTSLLSMGLNSKGLEMLGLEKVEGVE